VPYASSGGLQAGAEFSRQARRHRFFKEKPRMATISGTRTLNGKRDFEFNTRFPQSHNILLPFPLIEIDRQKTARFIEEHGINSNDHISTQVVVY
jgi:hypothetical protein